MVAQQILSILSALAANMTRFTFEGHEISLVWSCGIFITMNPGWCEEWGQALCGPCFGQGKWSAGGPSTFAQSTILRYFRVPNGRLCWTH